MNPTLLPRRVVPAGLLLLAACLGAPQDGRGTVTGNPITPAESLLRTVCQRVEECTSLPYETCQQRVRVTEGIEKALGVGTRFGTYQGFIDANRRGRIVAERAAFSACTTDILALGCHFISDTLLIPPGEEIDPVEIGDVTPLTQPVAGESFSLPAILPLPAIVHLYPTASESCGGSFSLVLN
ncbi:MAG: hypothetical protein AB7P04_06520 [Bacteriovoracia bacterium]